MPTRQIYFRIFFFTSYFALFTFHLSFSQSGWGPDTRLVFMQGGGWYPKAACSGDTIHLVWWQAYIGHDEIFYKRSTDAGNTWGADVRLSVEDGQKSILPEIAVSGNTVHVVWLEYHYGLVYRRSLNGGTYWQQIDSIIPGMIYSSIQALGDTIYVAGITSSGVLKFTKSIDGGNSWLPIINIAPAMANPTIRLVSNNILSLTISYRALPRVCEVYNVLSFNGGQTWFESVMVSEDDGIGSQHPAMDTDDLGGIHITWYDYKYTPYPWTGDIFYRASRDSGNTWEEIDSLTVMHRARASDILVEGNNLHLVWEDDRNGFDNNFEIYYRMSTDLGRSWGPEERLTNAPYHSYSPSLAYGGGHLHLFWQDRREYGNNGPSAPIYYKRKNLNVGIRQELSRMINSTDLVLDCPTILMHNSLIRYDLGKNKCGEINIIDVTGRVIGVVPVHQVSGVFVLGDFNKDVQDGVYFIMLKSGKDYITRKVLVVE